MVEVTGSSPVSPTTSPQLMVSLLHLDVAPAGEVAPAVKHGIGLEWSSDDPRRSGATVWRQLYDA